MHDNDLRRVLVITAATAGALLAAAVVRGVGPELVRFWRIRRM
jgi:hypothetical protein